MQEVDAKFGKGTFTLLGRYVNSSTPIKMKHNICGHIVSPRPNDIKRYKTGCSYCQGINKRNVTTKDEISRKILDRNTNLAYVSGYSGIDSTIVVKCTKHDVEFETAAVRATRKSIDIGCSLCRGENSRSVQVKSIDKVRKELYKRHKDNITLVGDYINTHTKIEFLCNRCNNTFKSEPNSVLRISGCPFCKEYKGEAIIKEILNEHGITFEFQKRFKDLLDSAYLSYDFFIPSANTLVEFNGEQHYKPIEFFGGDEAFRKQIYHDKLKREYAKRKGFSLIEIPYTLNKESIENKLLF